MFLNKQLDFLLIRKEEDTKTKKTEVCFGGGKEQATETKPRERISFS